MDILEGPDLFDFIASRSKTGVAEHDVANIVIQMLTAVHYLHRVIGFIHRDIKPENFGFTQPVSEDAPLPTLKVFDFGLAWFLPEPVTHESASVLVDAPQAGTANYMAPECWRGLCGPPSDVWGIGVIAFMMICMDMPFKLGRKVVNVKQAVTSNTLVFNESKCIGISAQAKNFVSSLLSKEAENRAFTSSCLTDSWLRSSRNSTADSRIPLPPVTEEEMLPQRTGVVETSMWQSVAHVSELYLVDGMNYSESPSDLRV